MTTGTDIDGRPVVLHARDLRKRYGSLDAVRGVGFDVHEGETYGLLGPDGAGKTTTISMVCGLLARDGGEVTLDAAPVDVGTIAARAGIGYVPQEPALYPDLSGRENLRFFGRLYDLTGSRLTARVDEVLARVGLTGRAGDRVATYSRGMQGRLNIGIGLLHRPRLLLLDEPAAGLDSQSRQAVLESIVALERDAMAIVYATNRAEEAGWLCQRIGIIDGGEIRAEGTRGDLVASVGGRHEVRLSVTGDVAAAVAAVGCVEGVERAGGQGDRLDILVADRPGLLPRLLAAAEGVGAGVRSVDVVEPDLEAAFLHLTGRPLRDPEEQGAEAV